MEALRIVTLSEGVARSSACKQREPSERARWQPNPVQLAPEHQPSTLGEEAGDTDRRNLDRAEREEVSSRGKGSEERDAATTVREGIEDTVRSGSEEQVEPHIEI